MINLIKTHNSYKYLWQAELADGTFVKQHPEDKSKLDKQRNSYYDLLQYLETNKKARIRRFSLVGEGNVITVDLGTGIFRVNGLPLLVESEKLPTLPDEFKLIWYHQVTQNTNVTVDKKTGGILKNDLQPEYREYFIGWQCKVMTKIEHKNKDGTKWFSNELRNYQQKIAVS